MELFCIWALHDLMTLTIDIWRKNYTEYVSADFRYSSKLIILVRLKMSVNFRFDWIIESTCVHSVLAHYRMLDDDDAMLRIRIFLTFPFLLS